MARRFLLLFAVLFAIPALALAADTGPKKQINPADQAKASSIVLKRTDFVAGWKRLPAAAQEDDLVCSFYRPNGSDLTLTGEAQAEYERAGGIPSVLSYAEVYASTKDAMGSWTRTIKPALARCIAEVFKQELADANTKVTILKQGPISFPRVAARTAAFRVALRIVITDSGETSTLPLSIHIVVVGQGRAEAGLLTFAPTPGIAGPDLRGFAKLLAERMKKAGF